MELDRARHPAGGRTGCTRWRFEQSCILAFPTGSKVPGSEEVSARQLQVATVSAAVKALTRFLGDLPYFLTGEGSWSLRPHERVVIEAAIDTLPEHAQALLHSQLNGTMF